jgi:diguanylate cyclase (GGDEF)-like protein
MTGLLNKQSFLYTLENQTEISRRYGNPIAVFVVDGDRFKAVNDTYGHLTGDKLILDLSKTFSRRGADSWYHIGGDEFAGIFPETDGTAAEDLARTLVDNVSTTEFYTHEGQSFDMTISLGGAVLNDRNATAATSCPDSRKLFDTADKALYDVKAAGGNGYIIQHCSTASDASGRKLGSP